MAALAGVRIEAEHLQPRHGDAEARPEFVAGDADHGLERFRGDADVEHRSQGDGGAASCHEQQRSRSSSSEVALHRLLDRADGGDDLFPHAVGEVTGVDEPATGPCADREARWDGKVELGHRGQRSPFGPDLGWLGLGAGEGKDVPHGWTVSTSG